MRSARLQSVFLGLLGSRNLSFSFQHFAIAGLLVCAILPPANGGDRKKNAPPAPARVEVRVGIEGCSIDIDSGEAMKTGDAGHLVLESVEPGEHYLHIDCPGVKGSSRLILAAPGETLTVEHQAEVLS